MRKKIVDDMCSFSEERLRSTVKLEKKIISGKQCIIIKDTNKGIINIYANLWEFEENLDLTDCKDNDDITQKDYRFFYETLYRNGLYIEQGTNNIISYRQAGFKRGDFLVSYEDVFNEIDKIIIYFHEFSGGLIRGVIYDCQYGEWLKRRDSIFIGYHPNIIRRATEEEKQIFLDELAKHGIK